MYKFAEPDATKCPLCGTALNPGSFICTGCGAKKKVGSMYFQNVLFAIVVSCLYNWLITTKGWGAIIAGVVAMALAEIALRKQVRWVR